MNKRQKNPNIPKEMAELTNEDGDISLKVEKKASLDAFAKKIYSGPKAGLRETINNEARPCREARKKGFDARIYITANSHTRTIVIEGINSMGMTMEMFTKVYTTYGNTGNKDGTESGQFGFGRAAYLTLSEIMVFETYSRETNEKFGFIGKSGAVFDPMPEKSLSIKEYGTKITLTVYPSIKFKELLLNIADIGRFLNVPVYLEIIGPFTEFVPGLHVGMQKIGSHDPAEFIKTMCEKGSNPTWFDIETDDYKLVGVVGANIIPRRTTLLIGVPISMREIPLLSAYVLNIKNERKFMPTTSRDSLTAKAENELLVDITAKIKAQTTDIKLDNIRDFPEHKQRGVIECARYSEKMVSKEISELSELMNTFYNIDTKSSYNKPASSRVGGYLYSLLKKDNGRMFFSVSRTKKRSFLLFEYEPDAVVFYPGYARNKSDVTRLEKFGVTDLTKYLKEQRKKKIRAPVSITVYIPRRESSVSSIMVNDSEDYDYSNVILVPRNIPIRKYVDSLKINRYISDAVFTKENKALADKNIISLSEIPDIVKKTEYETSRGTMNGGEILSNYKSITIRDLTKFSGDDIPSYKICNQIVDADIIVDQEAPATGMISSCTLLQLASRMLDEENDYISKYNRFHIINMGDSHRIENEKRLVETGIKTRGDWTYDFLNDYNKTHRRRIFGIRNVFVREMYATFISSARCWNMTVNETTIYDTLLNIDKIVNDKPPDAACLEIMGYETGYGVHQMPAFAKILACYAIKTVADEKTMIRIIKTVIGWQTASDVTIFATGGAVKIKNIECPARITNTGTISEVISYMLSIKNMIIEYAEYDSSTNTMDVLFSGNNVTNYLDNYFYDLKIQGR